MNQTWWISDQDLNAEQKAIFKVSIEESCLVLGPPGSGKTNLLVLRAKYLKLAQQHNVVLVTFTSALHGFLEAGCKQYNFPVSKICTSHKLFFDVLHLYSKKVVRSAKFEEQRKSLIKAMNALIEEKELSNIYDAILLDEAHDYLPEEIAIFRRLGRVLFAVADARQIIYQADGSMEALGKAVDKTYTLSHHYRNGLAICKVADAIAKDSASYQPLTPTCNYDEAARPSAVEHFRAKDLPEQAAQIIEKLTVQLKAYPEEMLGVLCPVKDDLQELWKIISASSLGDKATIHLNDEHPGFDHTLPIFLCTVHAAKGLEFRAVHFAAADKLKKFGFARNMAFTAVTRAKTSLNVYYSDDLHGFLEKSLVANDPPANLPNLKDLF